MPRALLLLGTLYLLGSLIGCGASTSAPASGFSAADDDAADDDAADAPQRADATAERSAVHLETRDDLRGVFVEAGFPGSFVWWPQDSVSGICVGDACDSPLAPASTFKIPHALIALETGVATGPAHLRPWDGQERSIDVWNRDHTLASAIDQSVVWYFQAVARAIGTERMGAWLARFDYGSRTVEPIDEFWLQGSLTISPREQVAWWHRFMVGDLPVSDAHRAQVAEMATRERWAGGRLVAKTGWAVQVQPNLGWFTGCVEQEGRPRGCFATVLVAESPYDSSAFLAARTLVSRRLLRAVGMAIPD